MKIDYLDTDGTIREGELHDWSQAALNQLEKAYGYRSFRPGQLEAVDAILDRRDLIAVMPTGSGKSVCYQLPALRPGTLTVVVSPLRALMRDQVQALRARGVPAALIDGGVTPRQRRSIYDMAHGGGLRILYVAPERLGTEDFTAFAQSTRIDLLAVDEAHCVLQWGNDFRPSYLRIGSFIASLPARPVVAAFTATATRGQVPEIAGNLGLDRPVRVGTGFDRPNSASTRSGSGRRRAGGSSSTGPTRTMAAASSTATRSRNATGGPDSWPGAAWTRPRSTRPWRMARRRASRTGSSPDRRA